MEQLEFRDRQGKWHEIDLLVLGRRRLHLVELKYYSGTLRGDDLRWLRDGHWAEDSPLLLARRKAQRLASKLQDEFSRCSSPSGVTNLLSAGERLAAIGRVEADRAERPTAEAFQAPEGVWSRNADRVRLDVFALGALTYYLFTGRPPAADRTALRERLRADSGLDLAADVPQISSAVRTLVLEATRPAVSDRLTDVGAFLDRLAQAERPLLVTLDETVDPLDAVAGARLDGRFQLERRLGVGSTAVGLLVTDLSVEGGGAEADRVLKVALNDTAAVRLADEAQVLAGLNSPRLVRMIEGPIEVGGRQALLLGNAGPETLADVLKARNRLSLPHPRAGRPWLPARVSSATLGRPGIRRLIPSGWLPTRRGRGRGRDRPGPASHPAAGRHCGPRTPRWSPSRYRRPG